MKKLILLFIIAALSTNAQNIEIVPLETNSAGDDFAPFLTRNKSELYITAEKSGRQYLFVSKSGDMNWQSLSQLGRDVNSGTQNGSVAITPDGQYMVFAAYEHDEDGFGRTDLYSARKVDGEWTDIENLGVAINSPYWDSNPTITSDGRTLYFSSDRPGGKGNADIYVSTRTREGWTKAKPIAILNSPEDDLTPHIAYDNETFTFASNRAGGEGGFDIYFSRVKNGVYEQPQNAGSPINTSANEYSYFIITNSDQAYFSSDRTGGKGALDIYQATPNPHEPNAIVNVIGTVTDELSGDMLGADVIITNLNTGEEIGVMRSDDEDGEYNVVLIPGDEYSLTAEREGYLFHSERFSIENTEEGYDIRKDIKLTPIGSGRTNLLVFFDFDKFTLQDISIPELQRIVRFMNKNPDLSISLEGHTDDRGDDAYNKNLSQQRANSVKEYLVENGIDDTRIKTVGYGESKPLMNEQTEEARAMNRRVEMVIIPAN